MYLSPSDSLCDTHMHAQMHNTHSIYPQCTQTTHMYLPFFTRRHYVHTNPCTMQIHIQHSCMAHTHSTQTHIPPIDMHTIYIYSIPISHIYSQTQHTHPIDIHTIHILHPNTHSTHIHTPFPPTYTLHPENTCTQTPPLQTHRHMCCTRVHTHTHSPHSCLACTLVLYFYIPD